MHTCHFFLNKHYYIPNYRDTGGAVDSLESFDLDIKIPHNFVLHDKVRGNDENKWKFRLPWPLFDMTTVKIPVR